MSWLSNLFHFEKGNKGPVPKKEDNTKFIHCFQTVKTVPNSLFLISKDAQKKLLLKKIDLSGNELKSLPAYMGQFENVEMLNLNWNFLESLNPSLKDCFPFLQQADLSSNHLIFGLENKIEEEKTEIKKEEKEKIKIEEKTEIKKEEKEENKKVITRGKSLKLKKEENITLEYSNEHLSPKENAWNNFQVLKSFKKIQDLHLSKNNPLLEQNTKPEDFFDIFFLELKELKSLKILKCGLQGNFLYPKQTMEKSNLVEINLSENSLTDISGIWSFPNLTKAVIKKNKLESIFGKSCPGIDKICSLKLDTLELRENLFTVLPDLSKFEHLTHLDMGFNFFEKILKPTFKKEIPVKILFLDGNQIQKMSTKWLAPFEKHLGRLDLTFNMLKEIDFNYLFKLKSLEELAIRGNPAEKGLMKTPPFSIPVTQDRDFPDLIEKRIYLGSYLSAINFRILEDCKISHILTVAHDINPLYPKFFKYHIVKLDDSDEEPLFSFFDQCFEFIEKAKKQKGNVLIHCAAGISRSATVVISYLMKKHKLAFSTAYELVKSKRSIICPNMGFREQLQDYQKKLGISDEELDKGNEEENKKDENKN